MKDGSVLSAISRAADIEESRILIFDTIDSTNSEARRLAQNGAGAPFLIIARGQSAGRGRMGRSFYSPEGTGLYMTALFESAPDLSQSVLLTTAAAVAVARSIDALCGVRTEIKWVNDILLGGKKICGILCESFAAGDRRYVAVGVGINLYTKDFPGELKNTAASLFPKGEVGYGLAACIFSELASFLKSGDTENMIAYYKERSAVLGKRIVFTENGERYRGAAEDIDGAGRLAVRMPSGEIRMLSSGEISLRLDENTEV